MVLGEKRRIIEKLRLIMGIILEEKEWLFKEVSQNKVQFQEMKEIIREEEEEGKVLLVTSTNSPEHAEAS